MYQRSLRIAILALGGSTAATGALALGFGQLPQSAVFGRALDIAVPLLLDPGESLPLTCLSAEIRAGEQVLRASALRITVEPSREAVGQRQVRLRSRVVVLEPLLSVSVTAGCSGPVSRRFTVFADPPIMAAAIAAEADRPPTALPPMAGERGVSPRVPTASARSAPMTQVAAVQRRRGVVPRRVAGDAISAPVATRAAFEPRAKPDGATPRGLAPPRLQLEEPERLLRSAALAVATQDAVRNAASQAALAAQAAASEAEARAQSLDAELQRVHGDVMAQREAMEQLRSRLALADRARLLDKLQWLLLAVLAGSTMWLGLRLRALQRERQAGWLRAAQASGDDADSAPAFLDDTQAHALALAPARGPDWHNVVGAATAEPAEDVGTPVTAALDGLALTQPVGVDELIDLEQQVEFFLVLGDADAATELLLAHLRDTGGVSPLPYLRLLEIHRRINRREPYERIRERFQQRFHVAAPAWDDDPQHGRDLQDHPAVITTLQAAWSSPPDAMAALESLLFHGCEGAQLELPAYREVLILYAVARDLSRNAAGAGVDVLLPLMSAFDSQTTARLSILDVLDGHDAMPPTSGAVAAAIDLDLSEPHFDHGADAPRAAAPARPHTA